MSVQTSYPKEPAIGLAGQEVNLGGPRSVETVRSEEASAGIPFGRALKKGTDDDEVLLPSAATGIAGIALHAHDHAVSPAAGVGSLDANGDLIPGAVFDLMTVGTVYVPCVDGCTKGAAAFVVINTAGGDALGELRATADGANTLALGNAAKWNSTAAAAGIAELRVDFRNPIS